MRDEPWLKKKSGNGKRTKTTMRIGATRNSLLTKRGRVLPIRPRQDVETQNDQAMEVTRMAKKKGKSKAKKAEKR